MCIRWTIFSAIKLSHRDEYISYDMAPTVFVFFGVLAFWAQAFLHLYSLCQVFLSIIILIISICVIF